MSVTDKTEYYCKKCGVSVNPTDEKCSNGHDLKEVGTQIKLYLDDRLFVSDKISIVQSASEAVIIKLTEFKEIFGDLNVKQRDEYFDEINKNLEIIKNQTRKKSCIEKIKDKIMDNILSYVILLFIGYIVAKLFS